MKMNQLIAKFVDTLDELSIRGNDIPGLIMSSPGAGKTSTLELYAKVKDYNLVSLIASQYSADDILGIQSVQDGRLCKLTPSWFNNLKKLSENGKRTILFIDEITTCDEFIQSPLLNLIFNKSLGEESLPDNCFIIAAGNYSEELNGAFSVTAPLINRFMILNLSDSDYSMTEIIQDTFRDLNPDQETESVKTFLGLVGDDPHYDFDKFKKWVSENLDFTPSNITNNREEGMLGFCSIRSMTYSLDFAKVYMSHYKDDDWIRIVGDTLGKFKSGDDWLPIRNKLKNYSNKFFIDVRLDDTVYNLIELIDKYLVAEESSNKYEVIRAKSAIKNYIANPDRLTASEVRYLRDTSLSSTKYDRFLRDIYSEYVTTMESTSKLNFN